MLLPFHRRGRADQQLIEPRRRDPQLLPDRDLLRSCVARMRCFEVEKLSSRDGHVDSLSGAADIGRSLTAWMPSRARTRAAPTTEL